MVDLLQEITFTKLKVILKVLSESISIPTDCLSPCHHHTVYQPFVFSTKLSMSVQFTLIFLASFFAFASIFAYVSSSTCLSWRTTRVLKFHLSDEVFLTGNLISVTICSLIFFICPM